MYVSMYINVECEMMCYILTYIPGEECNISCVREYSVLNEHFVVLFGWSVASPHLQVEHMGNEQEQIKDLFCQYY